MHPQLVSATTTLDAARDIVIAEWTYEGSLPQKETVSFYLEVSNDERTNFGQIGVRYLDGQQIAHFVTIEGVNRYVDGQVGVNGQTLTAEFPAADLHRIGSTIQWKATLAIAGTDSPFNPEGRLTLPSQP